MAKKKVPPIFEAAQEKRRLRIFGVSFTAPHNVQQQLFAVGWKTPVKLLADTVAVDAAIPNLSPDVTYVVMSVRLARRLFPFLEPTHTLLVADSVTATYSVTRVFLDANVYHEGEDKAVRYTPADRWATVRQDAFVCRCGKYDQALAIVADETKHSLLNGLFTTIYQLPKHLQTTVKDLITRTLIECPREQALETLSTQLPVMLEPRKVAKFLAVIFDGDHNALVALNDVRPFALAGVPLAQTPIPVLAEKYKIDEYELNYLYQLYSKIRVTQHSTTLEDEFFSHRNSLIEDGRTRRGNLTANPNTH